MKAQVLEINNPFTPHLDNQCFEITEQISILGWLEKRFPNFQEFSRPTICLVNEIPVLRAGWEDYLIQDNDVVKFIEVAPEEPTTIFMVAFTVLATAASIYYMKQIPKPGTDQMPDQDPVYTLTGQSNRIKLMNPIEVPYGKNRIWPSYAARSYNKFVNDDQYLYSLMVIGQGEYHIEAIQVEDTNVSAFQDVEYEIIPPGGQVTLFNDLVVTSVEVANIHLLGPNDSNVYTEKEWYGGFVVNPPDTVINTIEIDFGFPFGLYTSNDKGGLNQREVTLSFEYRQINDAGLPINPEWLLLYFNTIKDATVNAKRITESIAVPPGRYEVRAKRVSIEKDDSKISDKAHWLALRGIMPDLKEYGDLTLLAVKAKATNNINDSAANRFNVIATRKLPTWSLAGGWSSPQTTRSIVWAFCDVFRATYGAKMADAFLDLKYLYQLDKFYENKGYTFDWIFDQKATVWEAAKTIARAGRAVPMLNGSVISMVIDDPKTFPVAIFNENNIVKGSFRWDIRLFETGAYDSVEIEYTDPVTWNPETILCVLPGSEGIEPEKIKLAGCINRNQAYQEGMYVASTNYYVRENISFTTGMEGHIPTFGDLISVSHELPSWGQSGFIEEMQGSLIKIGEPVTFSTTEKNVIVFRARDGSALGPYEVFPTATPNIIQVESAGAGMVTVSDYEEYPLFQFGTTDSWSKLCKVVNVTPSDKETVEIVCTNYDARVFAFDNQEAPAKEATNIPVIPSLPVVSFIEVKQNAANINMLQINWATALGAYAYVLQQSSNGTDWYDVARTTNTGYALIITPGYLYLRVAGINVGAGPWINWEGEVGVATTIPFTVSNLMLQQPFQGTYVKLQWDSVSNATEYEVKVYRDSDKALLRTVIVTANTFTYSIENAIENNANCRDFYFEVRSKNSVGLADTPATLVASNPRPAKLAYITVQTKNTMDTAVTYLISWPSILDVDLLSYRAWGSTVAGFIPSGSTLKYEGLANGAEVTFNRETADTVYYLKAAAVDIWDNAINLSDEVSFTVPKKP